MTNTAIWDGDQTATTLVRLAELLGLTTRASTHNGIEFMLEIWPADDKYGHPRALNYCSWTGVIDTSNGIRITLEQAETLLKAFAASPECRRDVWELLHRSGINYLTNWKLFVKKGDKS